MTVGAGAMAQARALFGRHGAGFVAAQLVRPVATLTQVMAGAWGMRSGAFLLASGLGAVLAIARYAAIGWASAAGLAALGLQPEGSLLAWLGPYRVLIGFVLTVLLGAALIPARGRQALAPRAAYAGLLAVGILLAVNLGALTGHTDAPTPKNPCGATAGGWAARRRLVRRSWSKRRAHARPPARRSG